MVEVVVMVGKGRWAVVEVVKEVVVEVAWVESGGGAMVLVLVD